MQFFTSELPERKAACAMLINHLADTRTAYAFGGSPRPALQIMAAEYGARLASRPRFCCVYANPDGSFHLLLIDECGGLIVVDRVTDFEAALRLCGLVNAALGGERARRGMEP